MKKPGIIALLIIFTVLILDQTLKIWVKTHMLIGEEIPLIGDKIILHFTENPGMAFGMEIGGSSGKLILTLFRIVVISFLSYFLYTIIKAKESLIYIVCVSLIIAGAMGNLIDSIFYGLIFNDSYSQLASFMPPEGGYAGLLYGNVVDMFYCPIIRSSFPTWMPFVGGDNFVFFSPIFNVADSAITISVFLMLIFYRRIFYKKK